MNYTHLNPYINQTIQIKFDGTTTNGPRSDMAIDNITLSASGSSLPDLLIQSITAPSIADIGSTIAVSSVIQNAGSTPTGSSTLAYYLSTNISYSPDDILLSTSAVGAIAVGATSTVTTDLMIPTGISSGTYYLLFQADYNGIITETNESNNIGIKSMTINAPPSNSVWLQNGSSIYYNAGNIGIGIDSPTEKLTVNGTVLGKEFKATLNYPWPDYVFSPYYPIQPLNELEKFIQTYGHLPNIPSAKEVEDKGIGLMEMNIKLLEKVEELTLYVIELEKRIITLENQ